MSYGLIQSITIGNCKNLEDGEFKGAKIKDFLYQLCDAVGMQVACMDEPYSEWDDHRPNLEEFKQGISSNLFIETSNISIHSCNPQKTIRVCIFTCKNHDYDEAVKFCEDYWAGECVQTWARTVE